MPTKGKRYITPQEWRAKFPDVKDVGFADAISVTEAAAILGMSDTGVRKRIQQGKLAGKVIARTCYIVSEKAAIRQAAEYRAEGGSSRGGRPRSKA